MKAGGGYTQHHSLTHESAAIVKQALTLARRRGNAQVTPLHVATALLASLTGLLRRACLQSHSHPLQCKALELCFNVALNRLPTSASGPLLGPHRHVPSLSNALVAAFKRAQAHQRRGSIESQQQQQQSILALKVEIEQLVISILDDPSVSRVMREAGFSSAQVKAIVEKSVSFQKCNSRSPSRGDQSKELATKSLVHGKTTLYLPTSSSQFTLPQLGTKMHDQVHKDDVMSVLEAMLDKKVKNTVIVSESPSAAESLVREVIQTFNEKDVPADMRFVQFISVPLFTLSNVSRDEFEIKLRELKSLVKSYEARGVVLYLGDLDWVSNFWSKHTEQRGGYYCPVECMIMQLSRMVCGEEENRRLLWLMGTATPQTYAKCKIRRRSLESLWCLHPLKLSVGSFSLSLSLDSRVKEEAVDDLNWLFQKAEIKKQLICCQDCSGNFKREAQSVMSAKLDLTATTSNSNLPSWLQQYVVENRKQSNFDQECDKIKDLCKKWNSICSSVHRKAPHFLFGLSSLSFPSPISTSSIDQNKPDKPRQSLLNWPVIFNEPILEPKKHNQVDEVTKPSFSSAAKPDLLSNPNSSPNSASSSEASQEMEYFLHGFKEFNSDNLNVLSTALEKQVPWQRDIIPDIVQTILKCRSGIRKAKREDCWLFFSGPDRDGKGNMARELAKTVFGSRDSHIAIGNSRLSTSDTRADDSADEVSNKRARYDHGGNPYTRFLDSVHDNPSRVFYIEDVGRMGYRCLKGFERAIRDGSVAHPADGETVLLRDAIVIFGSENLSCNSRSCSPSIISIGRDNKREPEEEKGEEINDNNDQAMQQQQCGLLDLNITATDGDIEDENSTDHDEGGILDLVDKQVVFTIQAL